MRLITNKIGFQAVLGSTVLFCVVQVPARTAETLEERIDGILSRMTLEEKILQLHQEGGMNTGRFSKTGKILHLK